MSDKPKDKPFVYVPNGAKVNLENQHMEDPKTKYDKRVGKFNRKEIKKLVKGKYGRTDNDS